MNRLVGACHRSIGDRRRRRETRGVEQRVSPWADGSRDAYVRLHPEMLTGRRIVPAAPGGTEVPVDGLLHLCAPSRLMGDVESPSGRRSRCHFKREDRDALHAGTFVFALVAGAVRVLRLRNGRARRRRASAHLPARVQVSSDRVRDHAVDDQRAGGRKARRHQRGSVDHSFIVEGTKLATKQLKPGESQDARPQGREAGRVHRVVRCARSQAGRHGRDAAPRRERPRPERRPVTPTAAAKRPVRRDDAGTHRRLRRAAHQGCEHEGRREPEARAEGAAPTAPRSSHLKASVIDWEVSPGNQRARTARR